MSSQPIVFLVQGSRDDVLRKISMLLSIEDKPKTFHDSVSKDIAIWKEAINDKID